jgi:two-component system chemotaxis response regulator CheY
MIKDAGYEVVGEAAKGADVLPEVILKQPDLVTLDMILPDSTGLDVLKEIKKHNKNIKVIMVSAVGQESIVNEAMFNGAEAYIVKPFKEEKVMEILANSFQ